ncbi:MAG: outer membrane beta-barrel protein [Candidatus Zixiibacteriota bacterium]|nr:MAG: outer membrane beta-barrel protein [candidate division Zixibacteria bacterium]
MITLREVKKRIRTVGSTRRITKAMGMLVVVILLSMSVSYAQAPDGVVNQKLEIGLRGGVSWARFVGTDHNPDADSRKGFTLGGYARIPISSHFSLQPDVAYTQKGENVVVIIPDDFEEIELNFEVDYIDIASLISLDFRRGHNIQPALFAGPWLAFNVNSQRGAGRSISNVNTSWGLVFGGRARIGADRFGFILDVRYSLGLSDAFENDDDWTPDDFDPDNPEIPLNLDVKTNALLVTLGLAIW